MISKSVKKKKKPKNHIGIHKENLWKDAENNLLTCLILGSRDGEGRNKGEFTFHSMVFFVWITKFYKNKWNDFEHVLGIKINFKIKLIYDPILSF